MAVDYFLKLSDIKGESQDAKHQDEIEIESFSWGASNPASAATSTGGSGRVSFQDIHFTMKVNKASPSLFLACASGKHLNTGTLTVRKAGSDQQDYYVITLDEILVTSYKTDASDVPPAPPGVDLQAPDTSVPSEEFSLSFAKIQFTYTPQDATGKLGESITVGWDLQKNQKI